MSVPLIIFLLCLTLIMGGCQNGSHDSYAGDNNHTGMSGLTLTFISEQNDLIQVELNDRLEVINENTLTAEDDELYAYDWSPDGLKLAYISAVSPHPDGSRALIIMKPGEEVEVLLQDWMLCRVDWSFDGDFLAVDSGTDASGRELKIFSTASQSMVATLGYVYGYCWAPDRPVLAIGMPKEVTPPLPVEDGRSASTVIFLFPENRMWEIKEGTSEHMFVPERWLDGERLVIRDLLNHTADAFWEVNLKDQNNPMIYSFQRDEDPRFSAEATLEAKARECFTVDSIYDWQWSPNGQLVSFVLVKEGKPQIFVAPLTTLELIPLAVGVMPRWKP